MLAAARSAYCLLLLLLLGAACTSSRGDVLASRPSETSGNGGFEAGVGPGPSGGGNESAGGAPPEEAQSGSGGAGGDSCPGAIFCTGFETEPEALAAVGTGTADIVSSPVHGGVGALRVSTANADDWARLEVPLAGLSRVGLRMWLMLDVANADFGASEVHVLAAFHPAPELAGAGANKVSVDLEAGYQLTLVETLTPSKQRSDSPLTPGQWHCVRLEISGDPGVEQASLELDGTLRTTTATNPSVVSPGGFQSLLLGIEYATGATPTVLYYDDIVVGETAAACAE